MTHIKAAIAGILSLFLVTAALAQSAPATLPFHSVYGRLGSQPGDTGPGQAIPFATLASQMFMLAPQLPAFHPSSGNLFGPGCTPASTTFWNTTENICGTGDVWQLASSDPSAAFSLNLTGTITVGDAVSLTITMGSGPCSGAGCTVTSGPLTGSDNIGTLSGKLACAIANNPTLFNLNGAFCSGGVVSGVSWGGYASGNPIGFVVLTGVGVAWDFNSNISMKVTASVSGAATEIVTFNNTTCGTRCSYSLDNNPALQLSRVSGGAPQPGSTLAAIYSIGATSACPTSTCMAYGSITNWVANSTVGAIQSAWLLATPSTAGALGAGTWFGQGVFSNYGGAPFATGSMADQGAGTFNAGTCYWIAATVGGYAGDSICRAGSILAIQTNGDAISLSSAAGVGINATPTGVTFTSNLGGFFAGSQTPTTGSGWSIQGSATPVIAAKNYATAAWLPTSLQALSIDFMPSGSATSGWSLLANVLRPDADNATTLGDGSHNISTVFTKAISGMTTPLSVPQGGTGLAAGTSGGIPYYSGSTTMASSGALTAGGIMVGGGAGISPSASNVCVFLTTVVLRCDTATSAAPTFLFSNSAADAASAQYFFDKSRSGAATNSGDVIGQFYFRGFATSLQFAAGIAVTQAAAASGTNIPSKIALSTSNASGQLNQTFTFDQNAHLSVTQASAPGLSAGCNGAGSSVTGSDFAGTVTGQTAAATTCTLTFGTTFGAAASCTATGLSSPLTGAVTIAAGTLVVNFASTANYKFTYHCSGA